MKLYHFLIFLFIFVCCKGNSGDNQKKSNSQSNSDTHTKILPVYVTEFESFVDSTMRESLLPGAAIAIVKDNEVIFLKGYGVKVVGTQDSVNLHTVFRIASVSKGFASMLASVLVHDKLIGWDDKVHKYLPNFTLKNPTSTANLSIRNVLSHTSGLPAHTFTNMIEDNVPYAKLRDMLCTIDCTAPVGTVYAYQNIMYSLISDIAEAATHKTYEELLKEKIFVPLGMEDASASFNDLTTNANVAMPHLKGGKTCFRCIKNTPQYYSVLPAAGVNASICDMSQWLLALLGNRNELIDTTILNQTFVPEIRMPRRVKYEFFHWPQLKEAYYGMGWRILKYGENTVIYHGGHVNGYRSEIAFCKAYNVGIVILTNGTGKLPNDGVEVFLDRFFEYAKK